MLLIRCPYCEEERSELEFRWAGEAHIARPENIAGISDEEFAEYFFMRDNDKGMVFERWRHETGRRLVLFTTAGAASYTDIAYRPDDILMFGRESAGVPEAVHGVADLRATIPMVAGARSLNLAVSAGMAAGEALRQLRQVPGSLT